MNDNDAPSRELFIALGASESFPSLLRIGRSLKWYASQPCPCLFVDLRDVPLTTIAHLRAACLLLDIPWVE